MKQFYPRKNINKLLLLIISLCNFSSICAQTYTESFDSDPTGGGYPTSFTSTIGGVPFEFTFNPNGGGGDFQYIPNNGNLNSASLSALSFDFLQGTNELVTIKRNNGQLFEFKSLYLNNSLGGQTGISVQGYKSNGTIGSAQSMSLS